MLLLRDTFADMTREAENRLADAVATNGGALGYANYARAKLDRAILARLPAGRLPPGKLIKLPTGRLSDGGVSLADALDPAVLRTAFGEDVMARDAWLVGAVRTAIAGYRKMVQKSREVAAAIPDNDFEKLLRLTGNKFAPVMALAAPRLMRFDEGSQSWVLDRNARAFVSELDTKYGELSAYQAAADADTFLITFVATTAFTMRLGSVPGMLSRSAASYAIAAAGNRILWGATSAYSLYETKQANDEVAFAFGAAPVLGDALFQEAVLSERSWTTTLALIGVTAFLSGQQVLFDLRNIGAARQIAKGALLAEGQSCLWTLTKLTENEQADFLAFLANARSLSSQGEALSKVQLQALKQFDRLAELAAKNRDAVANGLTVAGKMVKAQADLTDRLQQAINNKLPKEVIDSLQVRRETLQTIWNDASEDPRLLGLVSQERLDYLAAKPNGQKALALAADHEFNWLHLKDAFNNQKVDPLEMFNFVAHREELMKQRLNEAIAKVSSEIQRETGRKPNLYWKALGSTNLNSDLDFSVYGEGAERVVKVFSEEFRKLHQFKGLESGFVFRR